MDWRKIKSDIRSERECCYKKKLNELCNNMSANQIQLKNMSQEEVVSNWLTSYLTSEHGFNLNKQQFWGSTRIRYRWKVTNIPLLCICDHKMDMQHDMSCKKERFHHNKVQQCTRFNRDSVNYYMQSCAH